MVMASSILKGISSVFNGKTPSKIQQRDSGHPVLKIKDVNEFGIFRGNNESFVDEELANKHVDKWIEAGDILILNAAHNADYVGSKIFFADESVKGFLPTGEWLVIRANKEFVYPEYLYYWIVSPDVKIRLKKIVKGIHLYPKDVAEMYIGLPALENQEKQLKVLRSAKKIFNLRQSLSMKTTELLNSYFFEIFGDPVSNTKDLPTKRLDELCDLVRGSSPRPQGDPAYFGGKVPRLMIADITRDGVYVCPSIDSLTELGATKSRPMLKGDVVMAVSGAVGLPAILAVDACIHDGFVGFRSLDKDISPEYMYGFLSAYRRLSIGQAVGATFQNLKTDQIREWLVPIPDINTQSLFLEVVEKVRLIEKRQVSATKFAEEAYHSLLSACFS